MFEMEAPTNRLTAEIRKGDVEAVKKLIKEYGTDRLEGWANSCVFLCDSLTCGNVEVAKYLLSTDLKVNERNASFDCSPLHLAVKLEDECVIKMLLEKCSDVNVKSGRKQITPLYKAVCRDNFGITELLLNSGGDANSADCNNGTPLHVACENGNTEIVNLLLQNGANVNARTAGPTYRRPLHVAVEKGFLNVIKLLLSRGALVNARTAGALTPLHLAVESDREDVVTCLLDSGADANTKTSKYWFPLNFAVTNENKQMVKLLLSNGALINPGTGSCSQTPLHAAAETGREDILELLLSYGADVDAYSNGLTPVHIAAEKGHLNIVKVLLSKGASAHSMSGEALLGGRRPLHYAAGIGNKDMVQLFLSHGASINVTSLYGSALHVAISEGHKDIVHFLLESKAQINVEKSSSHEKPMHFAVEKGDTELVKLLLKYGNTVRGNDAPGIDDTFTIGLHNKAANEYNDALHIAARNGKTNIVKLLLSKGADVNSVTKFGSALYNAAVTGCIEIVKILLEFGASVNARTCVKYKTGRRITETFHTPLYKAAEMGHTDVVAVLLSHGASVDAEIGHTPIEIAAEKGDWEIVEMLLSSETCGRVERILNRVLHLAVVNNNKELIGLPSPNVADVCPEADSRKRFLDHMIKTIECSDQINIISGATSIYDVDKEQTTAHSFATKSDQVEIVKLLLDRGALINASGNENHTALSLAAKSGVKEIVELLLDRGANVNSNSGFCLPLQEAVKGGCRDIVEMLLKKGADVNAVDYQNNTALCFACESSNEDLVELLLNCGASTDTKKPWSRTPLCIATSRGNTDIVKLLLIKYACSDEISFEKDNYCDLFVTALYSAINSGHVEITDLLMMKGADLHKLELVVWVDISQWITVSALHLAVEKNNAELVKVILKYFPDPINEDMQEAFFSSLAFWGTDSFKVTDAFFEHGYKIDSTRANNPLNLFTAVTRGHFRTVEEILKACTNAQQLLYSENSEGFMPLHVAFIHNQRGIAEILIANGVDVNATDKYGKLPIVYCIENGYSDMFALFIPYIVNKQDLLLNAVSSKDLLIVTDLLKYGVDVNKCDGNGTSALHLTLLPFETPKESIVKSRDCSKNTKPEIWKEIVNLLLSNGAKVDVSTADGETPLHYAAKYGLVDIVALLVAKNANINAMDKNGFTPLHHSVRSNNVTMTRFLLNEGARITSTTNEGMTPLHLACESGYAELVALLVESANVEDCQLIVNAPTKTGDTPLHCVARNYVDFEIDRFRIDANHIDFYEVINILLRKGADLNSAVESQLSTPLHIAFEREKLSVANLFLRRGANVNAQDKQGHTPLHIACKSDNVEFVELLLKHFADVNAKDTDGITPIYALNYNSNYFDLLKLLLDFGARLDCVSDSVVTELKLKHPLLVAAKYKDATSVELLLKSCHVNTKNIKGETSLHVACIESDEQMVGVLLDNFADVNAKDGTGNTPLYSTCCLDPGYLLFDNIVPGFEFFDALDPGFKLFDFDEVIARSLLCHGAEVNTMCEDGTALHVAALNNNIELTKILVEFGADINTSNVQGISPLESAKAGRESVRSLVDSSEIRSPRCFFYLLSHCIKMKAANLYVSERNLHYLETKVFEQFYSPRASDYPEIPKLLFECEREISALKLMKISDSHFSLYDVVTGNKSKLSQISTYDVSPILESESFKNSVALYADIITGNFEKAKRRRELEEKIREFGPFVSLTDICRDHIFSYLTNADLRVLMNAWVPANVT